MAQHHSILNSPRKGLQNVAAGIAKKVARGIGAISGSIKFQELFDENFKINPNDRVFVTWRTVNEERLTFEVHYDAKEEKLLEIYLVA